MCIEPSTLCFVITYDCDSWVIFKTVRIVLCLIEGLSVESCRGCVWPDIVVLDGTAPAVADNARDSLAVIAPFNPYYAIEKIWDQTLFRHCVEWFVIPFTWKARNAPSGSEAYPSWAVLFLILTSILMSLPKVPGIQTECSTCRFARKKAPKRIFRGSCRSWFLPASRIYRSCQEY